MSYPPGMGAAGKYSTQEAVEPNFVVPSASGGSGNLFMDRFNTMANPKLRESLARIAKNYGYDEIKEAGGLTPLALTAETLITYRSTAHLGLPTSLDVVTPTQESLEIKVEDPVFVFGITYTINTCVFLPAALSGFQGPPPAPPFEPQVLTEMMRMDPADFVYIQIRRPGKGQVYMDKAVSLKQFCGTAGQPYFWNPIPVIPRGGQLMISASILPPGQQAFGLAPPFIDRIGWLQIVFHGVRFDSFGT